VTDEKILISTKRSSFGRHLAYVSRASQKGADAIVMSLWLMTRRVFFAETAIHMGAAAA
jgi:hypothetical protein